MTVWLLHCSSIHWYSQETSRRVGGICQWKSAYLACVRPWAQMSASHKNKQASKQKIHGTLHTQGLNGLKIEHNRKVWKDRLSENEK